MISRDNPDYNAVPAGEDPRPQEDGDVEGPSGDEDAFDDVEMPEMIRGPAENNKFEDQQRDEQGEKHSAGSPFLRVLRTTGFYKQSLYS
ncbi:hypothetical protein GN244_ATG07839 [Phytophthora infestans]|uniref:Uncharacterized protein n=1 Tax=Phytophthora infestans TaxID=4787 RepID=A0A833SWX1_PHYIN|nr:hypothetical protein GN244_ATG07839 [Phytophthora infestans]